MTELRKTQRRRVLKAGTISVNRTGGIDCTVRNLSDAGACLDVVSPLGIPDDFELVIGEDHSHQPCHVIWRSEKHIGIAFG
jgi:PilZ domain-containing protein